MSLSGMNLMNMMHHDQRASRCVLILALQQFLPPPCLRLLDTFPSFSFLGVPTASAGAAIRIQNLDATTLKICKPGLLHFRDRMASCTPATPSPPAVQEDAWLHTRPRGEPPPSNLQRPKPGSKRRVSGPPATGPDRKGICT
jgi:hypothetical protein